MSRLTFVYLSICLGVVRCGLTSFEIKGYREDKTPGPTLNTKYVPGTPGAPWTDEEIETTRYRILQAMHPNWEVQETLYGKKKEGFRGMTENKIMRLVFHDCVKYKDGSGGCDGCLNWDGMDRKGASVFDKSAFYKQPTINETDNKGLFGPLNALEWIYTTTDWPFQEESLGGASLQQLGKSRADLWQFAGLIALERALERANRACDLDKWTRQQTAILDGRDMCEIKIQAPLKFWSGRSDCISEDQDGAGYKASKKEVHPRAFGDAVEITDFFFDNFGMDAEHSQALQAVHAAVHSSTIGVKYTWFGPGYISNMYYKLIANHPTYNFDKGGDLSFNRGNNLKMFANGDTNGKPIAQNGWRASCMMMWNTTEGGPCFLRPTGSGTCDSPNKELNTGQGCAKMNPDGSVEATCSGVTVGEDNVIIGASPSYQKTCPEGNWSENEGGREKQTRHNIGWSNQFAFPWEVSAYWKFTTSKEKGQRAIGCPGLDQDLDLDNNVTWPYRNSGSPIFATRAMDCPKQDYKNLADIVDHFANDQQYWSKKFMEAWDIMATNGYSDLTQGPVSGWFGYYSLKKQDRLEEDLESQMRDGGIVWTDPNADPYICGHGGHFQTSCGNTFSYCIEQNLNGKMCVGAGNRPELE